MRLTALAFVAAMFPMVVAADPKDVDRVQTDSYRWSTSEDSRLGVMVMGLNAELRRFFGAPTDSGLLVAQVAPDSAAARAGIQIGDVITKFGATKVDSVVVIMTNIEKLVGPQKVAIELIRGHKPVTVEATLGRSREQRPGEPPQERRI